MSDQLPDTELKPEQKEKIQELLEIKVESTNKVKDTLEQLRAAFDEGVFTVNSVNADFYSQNEKPERP